MSNGGLKNGMSLLMLGGTIHVETFSLYLSIIDTHIP